MPEPLDEALRVLEIRERLARAYAAALAAQHSGCAVEIHLGSEVLDYLKSLATEVSETPIPGNRLWGFPAIESTAGTRRHISVHAVTTIL